MQPHLRQHLRRQLIRRLCKFGGILSLEEVTPGELRELQRLAEADQIVFEPRPTCLICRLKRPNKDDGDRAVQSHNP